MTVRKAMQIGGLKEGKIIAGFSGTDKIIESVSVIEVPEATAWYRGGELFITAFYAIKDNIEAQLKVITNIYNHGGSGLVLCHIGVWVKEIAQEVIDLANSLAFPIITVPPKVAYIDIIVPLMAEILKLQSRKLEYTMKINKEMTGLILGGKDIKQLAISLEKILNKPVVILDSMNRCVAQQGIELDAEKVKKIHNFVQKRLTSFIRVKKNTVTKLQGLFKDPVLLYPIISGQHYYGTILTLNANLLNEWDVIAISQAAIAFGLVLLKEKNFSEIRDRMRKDFLSELLSRGFKNKKELLTEAAKLGWDLTKKHIVLMASVEDWQGYSDNLSSSDQICFKIIQKVIEENPKNIAYKNNEEIVIFLHCEENTVKQYNRAKKLGTCLTSFSNNIFIGIGSLCSDDHNLGESYNQARKALEIGKKLRPYHNCTLFSELGIYLMLQNLAADQSVINWAKSLFSSIEQYDNEHQTELSSTFKCLLDFDGDTIRVANNLFLHKNTVLKRKKKIIGILGYDPFERPNLLSFKVARELEKLSQ